MAQPIHRRHRKRVRTTDEDNDNDNNTPVNNETSGNRRPRRPQQQQEHQHRKGIPLATLLGQDDSAFAFLHDKDDHGKHNATTSMRNTSSLHRHCHPESNSLPILLECRRMGGWKTGRQASWQSRVLLSMSSPTIHNSKTEDQGSRRSAVIEMSQSRHPPRQQQQQQGKRYWRPYATRSIPFTHLGTPPMDAVLALERKGSYVIALGGNGGPQNDTSPTSLPSSVVPLLALRFYGVPSPSSVLRKSRGRSRTATSNTMSTPLLQSTILLRKNNATHNGPMDGDGGGGGGDNHGAYDYLNGNDDETDYEQAVFNFRRGVSPSTTPVQILLSSDSSMGVAQILPTTMPPPWRDDAPLGTLVIFSLPGNPSRNKPTKDLKMVTTTFQCDNVRMGASSAFTCRNLLWRVTSVPTLNATSSSMSSTSMPVSSKPTEPQTTHQTELLCDKLFNLPGHLFWNDEEDGYRLTWVVNSEWDMTDVDCIATVQSTDSTTLLGVGAKKSQEPILTLQTTWEKVGDSGIQTANDGNEESQSSQTTTHSETTNVEDAGLTITLEAFLHVETLLMEILSHYKSMQDERHPEYYYNLVSVVNGGRIAELVLAFLPNATINPTMTTTGAAASNAAPKKKRPLALFVQVDLFHTGSFRVLEWVQQPQKASSTRTPATATTLASGSGARGNTGGGEGGGAQLRKWCNTLALNRRLRSVRAGPYSINTSGRHHPLLHSINWGHRLCCNNVNSSTDDAGGGLVSRDDVVVDHDESDDYDPNVWHSYYESVVEYPSVTAVVSPTSLPKPPPKEISLSSLYPDCDLVSNKAVTSYQPVSFLECKQAPLELFYG